MSANLPAAILLVALLIASVPVAFAADFTSTSFKTNNPGTTDFGGGSTSTSFSSVSAGGQTSAGESTSTSFVLDSGIMYFDSFAPAMHNWRWYDDSENETPTTALVDENVAPSDVVDLNVIKLRISVKETAMIGKSGTKFRLQYSTSSDFSTGGYMVSQQSTCTGASVWCYADGVDIDNAGISTALITGVDSCSGGVGDGCGTHNESGTSTSAFTQVASSTTEYEFTIQGLGTAANTVYFFRLFDTTSSSSVPLYAGASHPSISTGGTDFTIVIGSIATSTTIAGVTTNIGTTPTSVPFGQLPQGSAIAGAQQLTVTTNAGQGYTIYAYQRQAFLGTDGSLIAPVTGTNASPSGWTSGCNATTTGCYGYHTTESVLYGGSTRFAPDDTYARFGASPDEIAYSSTPVSNKTTQLLYRVMVEGEQPSGAYETSIVYIAVPVF